MSGRRNEIVKSGSPGLTPAQKAAVILASLGPEVAGPVMQAIGDRHLLAFVDAIGRLKSVPAGVRQQVVVEFIAEVDRRKGALPGGADEARRILTALGDEERIARILGDRAASGDIATGSVWTRLEAAPDEPLVNYLSSLRAATAALILRQLTPDKIASVMTVLEPAAGREILSALSRETQAPGELIEALADAIDTEFLQPFEKKPKKAKVSEIANDVLGLLSADKREDLLKHLETEDPEAAAEIKSALITFEGLPDKLDEAGAAALLRGVERQSLLVALVHGEKNAPQTVAFLMGNVSKRMAEQYTEEMKEMRDVSEADGETAQRKICSEMRRLVRGGEITLKKQA